MKHTKLTNEQMAEKLTTASAKEAFNQLSKITLIWDAQTSETAANALTLSAHIYGRPINYEEDAAVSPLSYLNSKPKGTEVFPLMSFSAGKSYDDCMVNIFNEVVSTMKACKRTAQFWLDKDAAEFTYDEAHKTFVPFQRKP